MEFDSEAPRILHHPTHSRDHSPSLMAAQQLHMLASNRQQLPPTSHAMSASRVPRHGMLSGPTSQPFQPTSYATSSHPVYSLPLDPILVASMGIGTPMNQNDSNFGSDFSTSGFGLQQNNDMFKAAGFSEMDLNWMDEEMRLGYPAMQLAQPSAKRSIQPGGETWTALESEREQHDSLSPASSPDCSDPGSGPQDDDNGGMMSGPGTPYNAGSHSSPRARSRSASKAPSLRSGLGRSLHQPQRAHLRIEKRYRAGLKDRFQALRECVTERKIRESCEQSQEVDDADLSRLNKADVLGEAVSCINGLSEENELLRQQVESLQQQLNNQGA